MIKHRLNVDPAHKLVNLKQLNTSTDKEKQDDAGVTTLLHAGIIHPWHVGAAGALVQDRHDSHQPQVLRYVQQQPGLNETDAGGVRF
mgnify:CR=1 FL=1